MRTTKNRYAIVNILITVVLLVIIVNQVFWLNNMYSMHQRELQNTVNQEAKAAVLMEISERTELIGGVRAFGENIALPSDTSRFIVKSVTTEDSTYTFTIDKNDPNIRSKIIQFVIKDKIPASLDKLRVLFEAKISDKYDIESTYFDYLDLENDLLVNTNKPVNAKSSRYVKTDTIPMDILNSIGVIGYVRVFNNAILDKMMYQLILSVLLIVIGIVSFFYISRSFIFQFKTEKMRQDSVNAMTHEFKRPISSAVAMSSLIPFYLEKEEISRVLDYTNNIQLELNKLTEYTKRIQQISNNEKGNLVLNKTKVAIEPFFNSLKERYHLSADSDKKTLMELDIATTQKEMCVDLLHFSNVLDNLIENAIKYSDKAVAEITIHIKDVADGLSISVKDNGMGISSTDKKRIFDKFYRVERAETKNKMGFGLGLTYVKSVIDAHGATIEVVSKLNEGSEFVIILKD